MEFFKKTKDNLNTDIENLKQNKKLKIDQQEIKKKLDEAQAKQEKELNSVKETQQFQSNKPKTNYHAWVKLYITSGSRRERIATLGAFFGHKEGKQTLKVLNKDKDVIFEEIKPDWQGAYKFSDKDTIEKKINNLKLTLKKFENQEIHEKKDDKSGMVYYEQDYRAMLRKAEQEYAILVLGSEGTYSETAEDGLEEYSFDIVGFFKIPMFFYNSKSILGLPPASKIVVGQYLEEILLKNFKADEERAQKIIMTLVVLGFIAGILGLVYMMYHNSNAMIELAKSNSDLANSYTSSINVTDIMKSIGEKIDITNGFLKNTNTNVQNVTTIIK